MTNSKDSGVVKVVAGQTLPALSVPASVAATEVACTFCGEPAHKELVDRDGVCPRCNLDVLP